MSVIHLCSLEDLESCISTSSNSQFMKCNGCLKCTLMLSGIKKKEKSTTVTVCLSFRHRNESCIQVRTLLLPTLDLPFRQSKYFQY